MLKATSARRQKKGKETIEEGSGQGADCLLTVSQGKRYKVQSKHRFQVQLKLTEGMCS